MNIRLWSGDNTHFIEVASLKLQPDNTLVNGATVQVSIHEGGSPISGYTDPITLSEDTTVDGRYTGSIPAAADIQAETTYEVIITADTGSEEAEWRMDVRARKRTM